MQFLSKEGKEMKSIKVCTREDYLGYTPEDLEKMRQKLTNTIHERETELHILQMSYRNLVLRQMEVDRKIKAK